MEDALSKLAEELINNDPDQLLYWSIHQRIGVAVFDELKRQALEGGTQKQFNEDTGKVIVTCAKIAKGFLEALIRDQKVKISKNM